LRSAVRQTRYLRLSAGYGCARLRQCTGQLARVLIAGWARTRTTEGANPARCIRFGGRQAVELAAGADGEPGEPGPEVPDRCQTSRPRLFNVLSGATRQLGPCGPTCANEDRGHVESDPPPSPVLQTAAQNGDQSATVHSASRGRKLTGSPPPKATWVFASAHTGADPAGAADSTRKWSFCTLGGAMQADTSPAMPGPGSSCRRRCW
jgi:hypothetical protein